MVANKAFMREALRKLRPTDTFRIIRFSDAATDLTDGYIGNEAEILALIQD